MQAESTIKWAIDINTRKRRTSMILLYIFDKITKHDAECKKYILQIRMQLVWSSSWVRTLFFNPIRPDEQESKPSPRIRVRGLAQDSSSDGSACSDPTRNLKKTVQLVSWTLNSSFGSTTSSDWTFERTKILVRFNPSNKNPNPFNSFEQDR